MAHTDTMRRRQDYRQADPRDLKNAVKSRASANKNKHREWNLNRLLDEHAKTMAKPYELDVSLFVPLPIERVFAFFADAANLEAITPKAIGFHILTPMPIEMKPGAMIDYKLKLHGIPIRWRSEITAFKPPNMFIDEQRRGPYKLWRHVHRFESTTDAAGRPGTNVRDTVAYIPRGGPLIHRWFVRPELEKIFNYRQSTILELLMREAR